MLNKKLHHEFHLVLMYLLAFSLAFGKLVPIFAALLVLNWILEGQFATKFRRLAKNRLALVFMGFYLLHVLGLLYTSNSSSGSFDLEVKLSLFIFPLIFGSTKLSRKHFLSCGAVFILGCILASLFLIFRSSYIYLLNGENQFFYQAFSRLLHPSYFALYLNTAILLLFALYRNNWLVKSKLLLLVLAAYIVFIEVLLSSKMGLFTLGLLCFIGLIYLIISQKKYLWGFGGLILGALVSFLVVTSVPSLNARMSQLYQTLRSPNTDRTNSESSAVRLLIWEAAGEVVTKNPLLGVGTGDVQDALMNEYQKRGMTGAYSKRLNAHNAFYQVAIALGFVGLALLLACLLLPFKKIYNDKNGLYALFLLLIVVNFLVESMLETQAGVLFYAFFNALFCFSLPVRSSN